MSKLAQRLIHEGLNFFCEALPGIVGLVIMIGWWSLTIYLLYTKFVVHCRLPA